MKKTVLTSARAAYEPPYVDIIEFAVEGGFIGSGGVDTDGYDNINGTETTGREDVTDPWHS